MMVQHGVEEELLPLLIEKGSLYGNATIFIVKWLYIKEKHNYEYDITFLPKDPLKSYTLDLSKFLLWFLLF